MPCGAAGVPLGLSAAASPFSWVRLFKLIQGVAGEENRYTLFCLPFQLEQQHAQTMPVSKTVTSSSVKVRSKCLSCTS